MSFKQIVHLFRFASISIYSIELALCCCYFCFAALRETGFVHFGCYNILSPSARPPLAPNRLGRLATRTVEATIKLPPQ